MAESGDRKKELEQARNNRREEIPQLLLSRYDRILKAKKDWPLSRLEMAHVKAVALQSHHKLYFLLRKTLNYITVMCVVGFYFGRKNNLKQIIESVG